MRRTFIELRFFSARANSLGLGDEQLRELQADIVLEGGAVIPGTGGLRKIRWAGKHGGKRGGYRVIFADYPAWGIAVLITVFAKNVKENLSAAETRHLKILKAALDQELEEQYGPKKRVL